MSADDGRTWSAGRVLHPGPAAYSDLAVLPDGEILCLYEGWEAGCRPSIILARSTLAWVTRRDP